MISEREISRGISNKRKSEFPASFLKISMLNKGGLTVIGFIKAMGHVIDAVTDPLIAAKSDRSRNKNGRRIPMMKWAAFRSDFVHC